MDNQVEELSFSHFWKILIAGRNILMATSISFVVICCVLVFNMPDVYKSEILLTPAEEVQGGGLSALSAQFGGLASLAGIDLLQGETDKSSLALEILKSKKFLQKFLSNDEILTLIMGVYDWDLENNQPIYDANIYDVLSNEWVREVDFPYTSKPSYLEVYDVFIDEHLSINKDANSGLVTISISYYSPVIAAKWLNDLVIMLNEEMRSQDIAEATNSIIFLEEQLNSTSIATMQNIFYQLIEEQTKTIMLAKVRDEYIFKIIDPAFVPEEKSSPNRPMLIVLSAVIGLIISIFLVTFFYATGKIRLDRE